MIEKNRPNQQFNWRPNSGPPMVKEMCRSRRNNLEIRSVLEFQQGNPSTTEPKWRGSHVAEPPECSHKKQEAKADQLTL